MILTCINDAKLQEVLSREIRNGGYSIDYNYTGCKQLIASERYKKASLIIIDRTALDIPIEDVVSAFKEQENAVIFLKRHRNFNVDDSLLDERIIQHEISIRDDRLP